MTVEIWFKDFMGTEKIEGDLLTLTHNLNIAAANGKQFAIFQDVNGEGVMIETRGIVKAREVDDDAFVGS